MRSFLENRKFIENEFQHACFDETTGKSAEELYFELSKMQDESCDAPDRERFCAEAYAYLLRNMQFEINEHTPFSVKFNIGIDYSGFASIDIYDKAIFRNQRVKVLSEKLLCEYKKMCELESTGVCDVYSDFWHTVPDWNNVIRLGFSGILKNARDKKQSLLEGGKYTDKNIWFLDSVIICFEAMIRCMERMYGYSLKFDMPEFSTALKNIT